VTIRDSQWGRGLQCVAEPRDQRPGHDDTGIPSSLCHLCLSVSLYLSVCLFISDCTAHAYARCLSIYLSFSIFLALSLCLSLYLYVSVCLYIRPSVCLSLSCLFDCVLLRFCWLLLREISVQPSKQEEKWKKEEQKRKRTNEAQEWDVMEKMGGG